MSNLTRKFEYNGLVPFGDILIFRCLMWVALCDVYSHRRVVTFSSKQILLLKKVSSNFTRTIISSHEKDHWFWILMSREQSNCILSTETPQTKKNTQKETKNIKIINRIVLFCNVIVLKVDGRTCWDIHQPVCEHFNETLGQFSFLN